MLDGFQSDSDPSDLPFYVQMNDLSMHPIKKCQSLYSTENEAKMGFVLLLINIYDGTTTYDGTGKLFVCECQSSLMWLSVVIFTGDSALQAAVKGKGNNDTMKIKENYKNSQRISALKSPYEVILVMSVR